MKGEDGPFHSVVAEAAALIEDGATVFQRFTCLACLSRQTMPVPNVFYLRGKCDECGYITNIEENGCGFMLVISTDAEQQEEFVEALIETIESSQPSNRN